MSRKSTDRGFPLAEPYHFTLLNDSEQLDLDRQGELADFVQKQRAAVRGLEETGPVLNGAGKGATGVSEQFALDERVGKGATVHGDERSTRPAGRVVQRSREALLADPALAGDEDRRIEGRDPLGQCQDLTHGRTRRHRAGPSPGIGLVRRQGRGEDLQADGEGAKEFSVVIVGHVHLTGDIERWDRFAGRTATRLLARSVSTWR